MSAEKKTTPLTQAQLDFDTIHSFFEFLGVTNPTIQTFFGGNDPRKKGKYRGATIANVTDTILNQHHNSGSNLGVLLNETCAPYRRKQEDIVSARFLWLELDAIDLETQKTICERLMLPTPSRVHFSGNKSLHYIWKLSAPVTDLDRWEAIQRRLALFANGDLAVIHRAAVLRLPGSWNSKDGTSWIGQCVCLSHSDATYSIDEFDNLLPVYPETELQDPAMFARKATGKEREYAAAYLKCIGFDRANNYNYWLSVGYALKSVSADLLPEWIEWSRQSPAFENGVCEVKWESFDPQTNEIGKLGMWATFDNPEATQQIHKKLGGSNSRYDRQLARTPIDPIALHKDLRELYDRGLGELELKFELAKIAHRLGTDRREIAVYYYTLERKFERDATLSESVENLGTLTKIRNRKIDLHRVFPPALANSVIRSSVAFGVDPVMALQAILTASATLLGGKVNFLCKRGTTDANHWIEYPVVYAATVALSGIGKTPIQRAIFKPIVDLYETPEQDRVDEAAKEFDAITKLWKELSPKEKKELASSSANPANFDEKLLRERVWRYEDTTFEAIEHYLSEQPEYAGALWDADELAGTIRGFDRYKSKGEGSTGSNLNTFWNGLIKTTVRRKSIGNSRIKNQTLNICGSIQPGAISKVFDPEDSEGFFARFLVARAEIPDYYLSDPEQPSNLYETLTPLYQTLNNYRGCTVTMDADAETLWKAYTKELKAKRVEYEHALPAYGYHISKCVSYVGRLALILTTIAHHYGELGSDNVCTAEIMRKAIYLTDFYLDQFRYVTQTSLPVTSQESDLTAVMEKVYSTALKAGDAGITFKEKRYLFAKLKFEDKWVRSSQVFLDVCRALEDAGYGKLHRRRFTANPTPEDTNIPGYIPPADDAPQIDELIPPVEQAIAPAPVTEVAPIESPIEQLAPVTSNGHAAEANLPPEPDIKLVPIPDHLLPHNGNHQTTLFPSDPVTAYTHSLNPDQIEAIAIWIRGCDTAELFTQRSEEIETRYGTTVLLQVLSQLPVGFVNHFTK